MVTHITDSFQAERLLVADSIEAVNQLLYERGWTDGLPVVPPTLDRVARMVEASRLAPDTVIAELPPAGGVATVETIAINAVMAGCSPEHISTVIAATEAVADAKFNLFGVQATTSTTTPVLIVNGPIAQELQMNSGVNALGPGNRSNAVIGRALRLVLQNIGGGRPGIGDHATLGQPAKYTFCFAESEASSPWEPLHVQRGYAPTDSTVTVVGGTGLIEVADSVSLTAEELLVTISQSLTPLGSSWPRNLAIYAGEPVLILCPEHATMLAKAGFSRQAVQAFLWKHSRVPLDRFSMANQQLAMDRRRELGLSGLRDPIPVTEHPEGILIVVAGGAGVKSCFIPAWTGDSYAVTRRINVSVTN